MKKKFFGKTLKQVQGGNFENSLFGALCLAKNNPVNFWQEGERGQKFAFTLAEILITLGVIGIVAAMTIPTLLTSFQKKSTAARVKKAYAEITQAIKLSEAENESLESWEHAPKSVDNTEKFVEKYISPYYKGLQLCATGLTHIKECGYPLSGHGATYLTLNGTALSILSSENEPFLRVIIDVNNKSKPNFLGKDAFYFETDDKGFLRPFCWDEKITREDIKRGYNINGYACACKKTQDEDSILYRHACTALFVLDNWEFKNDYPW